MNPYLSFGLAMCAVVGLSLFLTAYLAVVFNRRAKADMLAALTPLSELLNGEIDLEESTVTGRYDGHIAEGRAANSTDGPGKVFHTSIIDSAGGEKWMYTIRKPKDPIATNESKFDGPETETGTQIHEFVAGVLTPLLTGPGWLRAEYDPTAGHVRITRPMATRRDIPVVDTFEGLLKLAIGIGDRNRELQQGSIAH